MVGPIALKIKYRTSNQIKNERERITKIGKSITLKIGKFYIDINSYQALRNLEGLNRLDRYPGYTPVSE